MADFLKQRPGAPQGFFAAEAAGLAWLAEPRAVPVVEVLEQGDDFVRLERLEPSRPSAEEALAFGARLARLHDAGAEGFGAVPSATSWFGPLEDPFEVPSTPRGDFATFWSRDRLRPLAERAARQLGAEGGEAVGRAIDVIAAGAFDGISGSGREAPSRVHGDLWSGNLMWTPQGATLIDPSAHGGHRLEDLALLTMFGAPHLDEILIGYEREHPMPADWREDLPAHLFFALLAHVVLFGGGYAGESVRVAEQISQRAAQLGA
jgi:fructosamine-3-kinase